ncbi:MAG: polysaccharide deacetylase family protein [Alcaligenaceae bacterium]|nr:polysaccharide deacetylase family protein [Alcaligenaceae bacterium]
MYHQIADMPAKGTPYRGLCVPAKKFRQQMTWLKRLGYRGLSMQDLLPYLEGTKQGKVFGITFDDGYVNVHDNALPVLQELGFTATTYFVAGHPGGHNHWDIEKGIPHSPLMNERQIRHWAEAGQEIGSHTLDHVHLTRLPAAEALRQIEVSKQLLEAAFGVSVTAFCYPYGDESQAVREMTRKAGYTNATLTVKGLALKEDDLLGLPRVTVSGNIGLISFLIKCLTQKEHRRRVKKGRY